MQYSKAERDGGLGVRPDAFRVLSSLLLRGTIGDLPTSHGTPERASLLERRGSRGPEPGEHERLFEQVPPVASVFLEVDGSAGGDVSATMARRLRAAGLPEAVGTPPDHLGHELALLASLMEQDRARIDTPGDEPGPDDRPGQLLAFLDGHLLWWLPPLVSTLLRHASPYWCEVSEAILHLVVEQRCALVGNHAPVAQVPWNLMGLPPDPLEDPRVGVREIAIFLVHPVRSGLYLSDDETRALAHKHRRPEGGPPSQILESALHSAVAYGGIETICERLRIIASDTIRSLTEARLEKGVDGGFLDPWLRRLDRTRGMLARMRSGEGPFL